MEPREAILEVLGAAGEPLHWTVIQDRALRAGYLDPFETPDIRAAVLTSLRALVNRGELERVDKGVYGLSERRPAGPAGVAQP